MKIKKRHKFTAVFLILNLVNTILPYNMLYANNNGPSSPESAGFESVDATDMVNLTNGDLSYVLPLMSVPSPEGGFPVSLSYHAGMTNDMDASWVGLGWYLNPGAINRTMNGTPDDWNGGVNINFVSMEKAETFYSVSVDVGLPAGASVGVGMNWGGNKGISGSVSGGIGSVSASVSSTGETSIGLKIGAVSVSMSASSTGDVSVGVSASKGLGKKGSNTKIGGTLSYSTKNQWKGSGVNIKTTEAITNSDGAVTSKTSQGVSLNSSGISINSSHIAGSGSTTGGAGVSLSSFSSGDYSVDVQSQGGTLPLHMIGIPVSLGFNQTKITYTLRKGYENKEWGALYSSKYHDIANVDSSIIQKEGAKFNDYQDRNNSMDTYEQTLPLSEVKFVADTKAKHEKANFTFIAYDDYIVNAQGVNGTLHPRIFQNINIFGKGDNSKSEDEKTHTFFHHGSVINSAKRSFGNQNSITGTNTYDADDMYFYFDGQFTSNETANINSYNYSGSAKNLSSLIKPKVSGSHYNNNKTFGRAKSPSYIEVFTNAQIKSGHAKSRGLITPTTIPDADRNDKSKYAADGIGAYKITSPDGKTYHFTLPVYHYERVFRTLLKENERNNNIRAKRNARHTSEKRQYSKYATHWLLTAITGPDYLDTNSNGVFDEEDYGYWTELEYGKWTDGFVWRTPYEQGTQNYNTGLNGEIAKGDYGYYSFGRKQLYYLDKIKTRTHTALFVKDIRYDGVGQAVDYSFDNFNTRRQQNLTPTGEHNTGLNKSFSVDVKELNVNYAREYTLKLDKIILLKNDKAALVNKKIRRNKGLMSSEFSYKPNSIHRPNWTSQDFKDEYEANFRYDIHQEQNVIDINDISEAFIAEHAQEVVDFSHDHKLAQNSPSSPETFGNKNKERGKLTLRKIDFKGRGGVSYAPPYKYSYYGEGIPNIKPDFGAGLTRKNFIKLYHKNKKKQLDAWGFMRGPDFNEDGIDHNRSALWSLKEITMPTGAKINIDYERDTYWTEAFARRYWTDELAFKVIKAEKFSISHDDYEIELEISNDTGGQVNFEKYFRIGDSLYFDLWLHYTRQLTWNAKERIMPLNLDPKRSDYQTEITNVTPNSLIVKFNNHGDGKRFTPSRHFKDNDFSIGRIFSNNRGSNKLPRLEGRYTYAETYISGRFRRHVIKYKLLATRVPKDETGGGLRVKKLITTASDNEKYITSYNYNYPQDIKVNTSSGITSYAPVEGLKYVPYQSELPPPGVMYEYVTVSNEDNSGNVLSSTRYRHNVLKPIFDIFKENIVMEAMDTNKGSEDDVFRANVVTKKGPNNVEAKEIDLHLNTGLIGQLKSIEELNNLNQILSKTENEYINGHKLYEKLRSEGKEGKAFVSESFNAMKSVFKTDENSENIKGTKRYLSISTKTEYNNLLQKVTNHVNGLTKSTEYTSIDPYLGSFTETKSKMSDGTEFKTKKIPAYLFYRGMQSKTEHPDNKNMLTQNAMDITSIKVGANWETIDGSVTTWNNNWDYLGVNGLKETQTQTPVWRKHKNFVWKGALTANGTYGRELGSNDFNWTINGTQSLSQWQQTSETTSYSHWSSPLETKDINNNYVSSKMGDQWSKTIAAGNARRTELFYSGAEYNENNATTGISYTAGVAEKVQNQTTVLTHTGKKSLKIYKGQSDFKVAFKGVGSTAKEVPRAGKYKVSVWMYETNCASRRYAKVNLNGTLLDFDEEVVEAGSWVQLIKYIDIPNGIANQEVSISVSRGAASDYFYFDDFRLCPIASSMSSYVYDEKTDDLVAILDGNNLATQFKYDVAGRLCKTYSEVVKNTSTLGGFKLVKEYNYNYQTPEDKEDRVKKSTGKCISCCEEIENVIVVSDNPVARNDAFDIEPNETKDLEVLLNDSFGKNGAQCKAIKITRNTNTGDLVVDDNGTPFDPLDDSLSYTAANIKGEDSFDYEICDKEGNCDTGTVSLHIEEYKPTAPDITITTFGNQIPIFSPSEESLVSFGEDGPALEVGQALKLIERTVKKWTLNDEKINTPNILYVDLNNPASLDDDYITFEVRSLLFFGRDSFTYQLCDADGDCAQGTVTIERLQDNKPTYIGVYCSDYLTDSECMNLPSRKYSLEVCNKHSRLYVAKTITFNTYFSELSEEVKIPFSINLDTSAQGIFKHVVDGHGNIISEGGVQQLQTYYGYEVHNGSNDFEYNISHRNERNKTLESADESIRREGINTSSLKGEITIAPGETKTISIYYHVQPTDFLETIVNSPTLWIKTGDALPTDLNSPRKRIEDKLIRIRALDNSGIELINQENGFKSRTKTN